MTRFRLRRVYLNNNNNNNNNNALCNKKGVIWGSEGFEVLTVIKFITFGI